MAALGLIAALYGLALRAAKALHRLTHEKIIPPLEAVLSSRIAKRLIPVVGAVVTKPSTWLVRGLVKRRKAEVAAREVRTPSWPIWR